MSDDAFTVRFSELLDKIRELPPEIQAQLQPAIKETLARHEQIRGNVAQARDSLASVGMLTQYILFSIEALQRELTDPNS